MQRLQQLTEQADFIFSGQRDEMQPALRRQRMNMRFDIRIENVTFRQPVLNFSIDFSGQIYFVEYLAQEIQATY